MPRSTDNKLILLCENCGRSLCINYMLSNEYGIVLGCIECAVTGKDSPNLYFVKTEKANFEEVTRFEEES